MGGQVSTTNATAVAGSTGLVTGSGTSVSAGADAYVTNLLANTVEIYDLQSQAIVSTVVVNGPTAVAPDGQGGRMWVTAAADKELVAIDATARSQTQSVALRNGPFSQWNFLSTIIDPLLQPVYVPMGVVSFNGRAFVPGLISTLVVDNGQVLSGVIDFGMPSLSSGGQSTLATVVSLITGTVESLGAFDATVSGGRVFVSNLFSDTVTVINPQLVGAGLADPVEATLSIVGSSGNFVLPAGVCADDSGRVYVACLLSGDVAVIDTRNQNAVTTIAGVGLGPIACTFDATSGNVYVANFFDGSVAVIDTAIGVVTTTHQVLNGTALLAALGMSSQAIQTMLQSAFGSLGISQGGTSAASAGSFLTALLSAVGGGNGAGGQGGSQLLVSLLGGLFQSGLQSSGAGASGAGLFGGLPVPGLTSVATTRSGQLVVTSMLGGATIFDPVTGLSVNLAPQPQASGALGLSGYGAVGIHNR